jgi:ABC-2 type transport system ATP-binding protein
VIAAAHLSRRFGARLVVDDVSLEVGRGEIVALVGPNGAGKTTTMRMLAGLIAPTSGGVTIDGVRLTRATGSTLRRRIGFLTEAPGLWDRLSVRENLSIYAGLYGIADAAGRIDGLLRTFDLLPHVDSRAAELSKGTRQKVALVRALLHEPDVLLLDEPTAGLDPEVARGVRTMLEEGRTKGRAILLSTHNLDEAERLADRIAILHERVIAIDRPPALRRRLTTGQVIIRLDGAASGFAAVAAPFGHDVRADGSALMLTIQRADERIPELIRALVDAGARIIEVRPELPPLEDVYLRLVSESREGGRA